MSNDTWGIFESMEDALYWIRQSEGKKDGYALIADATDTRYEYLVGLKLSESIVGCFTFLHLFIQTQVS